MKYTQLILVFAILCFGCSVTKNHSKEKCQSDFDTEFIDYLFKDYNGNKPGASIIIIKNGNIELVKSYGYADLENNIKATPQTNYRIASVTKQFTAMAIMLLENQGKLTYQTNLTEIFPEFPEG